MNAYKKSLPTISASKLTPDTDVVKDLGADSLALMELMFNLESETGKTLDDEVLDKVKTVGDLCKFMQD